METREDLALDTPITPPDTSDSEAEAPARPKAPRKKRASTKGSAKGSKKARPKAKSAKARPPKKDTGASSGRRRELIGLVMVAAVLAMVLALASYDPLDQSFNSTASKPAPVNNLIGPVGAYISDMLLQTLGLLAYFMAGALLLGAARFLIGTPPAQLGASRWSGLTMLPPTSAVLLHLAVGNMALFPYPPGGAMGKVLTERLVALFSIAGSYIIAVTVLLLSVTLLTGVSYGRALEALTELIGAGVRQVTTSIRNALARAGDACRSFFEGMRDLGGDLSDWATRRATATAEGPPIVVPGDDDDEDDWDTDSVSPVDDAAPAHARRGLLGGLGRRKAEAPADEALDEIASVPVVQPPKAPAPAPVVTPPPPPAPSTETAAPQAAPAQATLGREGAGPEPEIVIPATPKSAEQVEEAPRQTIQIARPQPAPTGEEEGPAAGFTLLNPEGYELPAVTLLDDIRNEELQVDRDALIENAKVLERKLKDYGVDGKVVEIRPGPVVTMYEFLPGPGIKVSKIAGLADDLAMGLAALSVRIVAPIPGKGVVGIEVPNKSRQTVGLKEIIGSKAFRESKSRLEVALGKDIEGFPVTANLAKMPHLLVAGATGAGKSVALNAMITSILYNASPDDVRMLMVDPKRLELSIYEGIPHLLLPVVYDPKQAALALQWAVKEMERRYALLQDMMVREVSSYNRKVSKLIEEDEATGGGPIKLTPGSDPSLPPDEGEDFRPREKLPQIVIIIDELADLMMVASRDVEASIQRLAQMARAAGIHLILATQRPSTDVITGTIKANFPSRIAFRVSTKTDARTILDQNGAENLLGMGDMLFSSPAAGGSLKRVHGAFVSDDEVKRVVDSVKAQGRPVYDASILKPTDENGAPTQDGETEYDAKWDEAVAIIAETRMASISMLQRRLKVGYNRAARMIEQMEIEGMVGPSDTAGKPREVLIPAPQ